jgi:predicted transposase YbfD/YdcC
MRALIRIFDEIEDPRGLNVRHDLTAMLFIALAATLCGAKSAIEIADFAAANEAELAEIVDLPHGAPSHDSFSRIFRLLDPEALSAALLRFAQELRKGLGLGPLPGVVAVDGKRMRRGYERGRSALPPLMVSVWEAETRLSLAAQAPVAGADPANEVAAALAALKTVMLRGSIVTADAAHCHAAMASGVLQRGADYALVLKGNHNALHAYAEARFAQAEAGRALPCHEVETFGHDRRERRRVSLVGVTKTAPPFPGLKAIARIEREREVTGRKTERSVHYVVLSRRLPLDRLMQVIRLHWSVENHLHRQLDVVFHEDAARSRKNNAPYNQSIIRRMALDMLRAHPDRRSPARKMNIARWKKGFLFELFAYMR